jgi:hypothetical protein
MGKANSTTANQNVLRKTRKSLNGSGYTHTQAKQIAFCEIWKNRGDIRRFLCSCDNCRERTSTQSVELVLAFLEKHKGHKTKITTRGEMK